MFYNREIEQCFQEFSSCKNGLEPNQVESNRSRYGSNTIEEKKKRSVFLIFLDQFKDFLVLILIIASGISLMTGSPESTAVILAVLILNGILGTVQYIKAEKSLDSLKKLSSPEAKVVRGGEALTIPADQLVCGDVIRLEAGDIVPGDARIIDSFSLKTNESSLTGESEPVEKRNGVITSESDQQIPLGDRYNMVYSGSLVTYGRATALVTAVGSQTELGKIAGLIDTASDRKTPLQETMDDFSKKLSVIIILICLLVLVLNLYRGMPFTESLLFAVALAVAAIPEALSSIITISLAIGTTHMAEENAIIKKLSAVESLGCVSVICSDKTGTLTQNKMTVEDINDMSPQLSIKDHLPVQVKDGLRPDNINSVSSKPLISMLELAALLCNDTALSDGNLVGDPTETALMEYCCTHSSVDPWKLREIFPRIGELPFDSDRKLMSTINNIDGQSYIFTKGAPDILLDRISNLSPEEKESVRKSNLAFSEKGLRVLAFACKKINRNTLSAGDESDLDFLGLMAMMDPPRTESAAAVADCQVAGIKAVMITGDHKVTAAAIAERLGIMRDGDIAITGAELDKMSDDELKDMLPHISVYARVSPDNKIRIVNAWQSEAHIVAMTGDGVNDAPALKSADVGVAMGVTGTEVAKDAASMILTDDNFATIIKAVLNGRNIYANIKNSIMFLLSGNAAGILAVLFASLMGLPAPFTAVQLLFINLVTDSLPALAIGMEPTNPALMHRKPRPRNESVLTRDSFIRIGIQGLLIGIATMAAYYAGLAHDPATATTMAFSTLCLARLWHGFNCRGNGSIFSIGIFSNKFMLLAFITGSVLLAAVLAVPAVAGAFSVSLLLPGELTQILLYSLAPTVLIQLLRVLGLSVL
ncbi:MAG: cation-translocating P-type ATPase [Eubacteriaceae bacterium]|nr:cation-translocating P-type ATPase [Eubacteriaceae bacterium]